MKTLTRELNIQNRETLQFPILPNGSGWKSTERDNLTVTESGADGVLFSKIIQLIDEARELICVQSFLIQDTEIIDALMIAVSERSVKVYILSSVEARLKDSFEEEYDYIKADYIQLIDRKFKNHFVHRTAENFHAKYIVIDPESNPKGFICTNNFTKNGFFKNPELAVELNEKQSKELFKVFVYHFWEHSTDEQTSSNEFEKVKPTGRFTLPRLESILLTSPEGKQNWLNRSLIDAVREAETSISLSTFQLDENTDLAKEIINKAKNNVSVELFFRPIQKQFDEQLKQFLDAGVQIFFHPFTHSKSLVIDEKIGFIFTANITHTGLKNGLEVGVELNENQTNDLILIHEKWRSTFPYKSIKLAAIKDLDEVAIFEDKNLVKRRLQDNLKEERYQIYKVSDLFKYLNQKHEIKDPYTRSLKVELCLEIEDLPRRYQTKDESKFEIIEVDGRKRKKTKALVIKKDSCFDDLDELKQWKDLRVYYRQI